MYRKYIKRILDIIFSLLGLVISLIFIIPAAIAIKIEDGGPIFYKSKRLGKNLKVFNMYKLRTMKVNAPDIRNMDGSTFNSKTDPRVTNVGRFLRKTSIDELPQVLNVLKGDMSFVGPRPSPLGNVDKYPHEYFRKFEVLPGLTGYNQALKRNSADLIERYRNDLYYIDNISFSLDVKIIFMTILNVLFRKNINRDD